ncbi:MAG TPA: thioredoxin domain-containing protein [Caldilineaceae bacterium]|nr:thioredoxin domain-containing protein [Caldilineaceae bacterium]
MTVSSRSKRKATTRSASRGNSTLYWLIGGGVVMIGLIVFAIMLNTGGATGPIPQPDVPEGWIDGMSLGDPEAPIVVEAYEDFLCPHCREWTESVENQLRSSYIKEGQVRLVYHTFPLEGFAPGSRLAAQAAYCAAAQNYFWPYHDNLFAVQTRGQSAYTIEELISYAGTLGLNERDFTQCMSSMANAQDIAETVNEGVNRGVTGTPSVFINGENVQSDWGTVQTTIDNLLAAN